MSDSDIEPQDPHLVIERPELEEKLSELEILQQSLQASKESEAQGKDQLLRLGAEFENYRKRAETRIADARKYGNHEILLQVMTLADALNQAVQASETTTDMESLKKGLVLVQGQLEKFMKDQGLVPIESVGQVLDPDKHEAMAQEISSDVDDGVIVGEIQRGYMLGDHVVRTAKVRVATKEKQASNEQEVKP